MKFLIEIEKLISNNKFEHYYLWENLLRAERNDWEINAKWKIGDDKSWILGVCANQLYNIYGMHFTQNNLDDVLQNLDLSVLPNPTMFSGKKELIDEIFNHNSDYAYEIYKERNFHTVTNDSLKVIDRQSAPEIRVATIDDLQIISEYTVQFFEEEYSGNNNKNIDEVKENILSQIMEEKFIVSVNNNVVSGYCSRILTEFGNELLGTVFVSRPFRGMTIGTYLVDKMTNIILANNPESWVMTDLSNASSNEIMDKIGYKVIYQYSSGIMRKL